MPVLNVDAGAQCPATITPSWMIMLAISNCASKSCVCFVGSVRSAGSQRKMPRSYFSAGWRGPLASAAQ